MGEVNDEMANRFLKKGSELNFLQALNKNHPKIGWNICLPITRFPNRDP